MDVLLVDDHPIIHETLRAIVRSVRPSAEVHSQFDLAGGLSQAAWWTAVVIGQVTVTVLFLMTVVSVAVNASVSPYAAGNFAFEPAEYVTVQLDIDRENQPGDTTVAGRAAASART